MHATHTSEEVMAKMERWVAEHRADPVRSRLRRLIPGVGAFFTPLGLVQALREYDEFFALSRRVYVPPNFAELRHVLNIAQVGASEGRSRALPTHTPASRQPRQHPPAPPPSPTPQIHASAPDLRLVTFDADGTLYADGAHIEARLSATIVSFQKPQHIEAFGRILEAQFECTAPRPRSAPTPRLRTPVSPSPPPDTHNAQHDNDMIDHIVQLLLANVHVAIVTAAGYPGDAPRFEQRVHGLLAAFGRRGLSDDVVARWAGMAGGVAAAGVARCRPTLAPPP